MPSLAALRTPVLALGASLFLAGACAGDDSRPGADDVRDAAGKADSDALAEHCEALTGSPDCDLCAELDLYGDGVCDDFCAEPDPDCPATEAACEIAGTEREELSKAAREFMLAAGLVEPGDERDDGFFVSRWGLERTAAHDGSCLAVMAQCFFIEDEPSGCSPNLREVIVFEPGAGGFVFARFEEVFSLPARAIVAIGSVFPDFGPDGETLPGLPEDLYYVELDGDSVIDAFKTVFAVTPSCGLAADISPVREKADFDPTPGRTWHLENPTFSLRRGNTAEIHDVRSVHLDGDFEAFFNGSAEHVAPWSHCFVRQLLEDGVFVDVPLP